MYAVIMAGGRGTRFWPKSREKMPKHLLDIFGKKTIIQETVERIEPLIPAKNILIVTGASHSDEVIRQLPELPEENIIIEPVGRNTAPCIGLAAMYIKKMNPEGVMVVLPSDHYIPDEEVFRRTLAIASEMAQRGNYLLTIGIKPTGPETGYGYMEQGEPVAAVMGEDVFQVRSFREKPDIEQAEAFLRDGGFFWNSGMFIWKASTILHEIEKLLPDLYEGLLKIEAAIGTDREKDVIGKVYREIAPISVDYGVMEKSGETLLVRGEFGWSDVGSWNALWEVWDKDENGNAVRGRLVSVDSSNSLVYSPDKLVALVGVEDLVVVETADSILVCKREASQDVKKLVEMLEEKNMKEYL
ncbi:MAG: mannose-1-phosphate guanylyltransferase [Proteobacteria bacterium]|nr:mannose-1-phosphate guanylyltransferase [Pseudomonadota bacterium]